MENEGYFEQKNLKDYLKSLSMEKLKMNFRTNGKLYKQNQ